MAKVAPGIAKLLARPENERTIGPFRLIRQLGRGGFAPVWLASESYGGVELRTVAVKLFAIDDGDAGRTRPGDTSAAGTQRERIVAEARALCQVEHPNVVRFFSIAEGEEATVLGLAMEYVNGVAIDRKLAEKKKLDLAETLAIGSAIASALAAVHENGLVHCDVKPANVVDALGVYKLIDFGIVAGAQRPVARRRRRVTGAASRAAVSKPVTAPVVMDDLLIEMPVATPRLSGPTRDSNSVSGGSVVFGTGGTLGYVDPACVLTGAPATPGSDLYALGATLFECITGKIPAIAAAIRAGTGGLRAEVLDGREHPPNVRELDSEVPPTLARIVDALLEPDPAKRPRSAEAVAWEIDRVRRELAGQSRELPPEERGPFRGLGRFEEADRDIYFGRGSETAAGLEMIRRRGLVAIIGPSGSGKSSLARAGLFPAIADGELGGWPKHWDGVVAQPGEDPRASIAAALEPLVGDVLDVEPEALVVLLAEAAAESGRGIVLLVDQLEELVTVSQGASRAWAVSLLARLGAHAVPGVRVLVAARRDLLDELLAIEELGRVLTRGTLLVTPLSDIAWEDVLDQALDAYSYRLEDAEMRRVLLAQLRGTSSAMPLVQFALARLWERRDAAAKMIPRSALEAIGGIGGALEAHADATLASVPPESRDVARDILLAVTTAQGTRKARAIDELYALAPGGRAEAVVKKLVDARLLTQEAEGLTLAHEALLTRWGALRRWVADAREDRLRAEETEREAAAWVAEKRAPERLLKGRRLRAAEELARRSSGSLGAASIAFLREGRAAARRSALFAASPLVALAIVALVLGAMKWDAGRLKTTWCANTVDRWQVPSCVATVSADEARHRAVTHRISTVGGRVVKLEHLNGWGVLQDDSDGYATASYEYDADDLVREVTFYDHLGYVKLRALYSEGARRVERRDAANLPAPLSGTDLITYERGTTDVSVARYEYDAAGSIKTVRYFNAFEKPRGDHQGAFGIAYQRDARGLPVREDMLGPDGNPALAGDGFARITFTYDDLGNIVEAACFDVTGAPTLERDGMHLGRFTYDAHGDEVSRSYFGATGKPIAGSDGVATRTIRYEDHGGIAEVAFYDTAGARVASPKAGNSGWAASYDARGNRIEFHGIGVDGNPVIAGGSSGAHFLYDAQDRRVGASWFDVAGAPTSAGGFAREDDCLDPHGNQVDVSYFGVDGKPMEVDGCAERRRQFDARDKLLTEACLDATGKPAKGGAGWATVVYSYDDGGELTDTRYLGTDGTPVQLANGYARIKTIWEGGNATQWLYYGADDKPALGVGGFFLKTVEYDARGDATTIAFLGTDSRAPAIHDGYSKQTLAYDSAGRLVAEAFYGTDGKPILAGLLDGRALDADGFARRTLAYDDRGNLTEERYFAVDGQPLTLRGRLYARRTWKYGPHNDKIQEAYFAYNDEPTRDGDLGVAGWDASFDDSGRELRRSYFDVDGKPAYVKDKGYASYTQTYDVRGNVVERAYFSPSDAPAAAKLTDGTYARMAAAYDAYGRETERAYFDADGKPVAASGSARTTHRFDAAGHDIEDDAFDATGAPVMTKDGWAKVTRQVDARGDVTEQDYFGVDGKPSADLQGNSITRAQFDERGHELERSFFDKTGAPLISELHGYARVTRTYDDAGNAIEEAYFDTTGAPTAAKSGAARVTRAYENDHPTDIRTFDVHGAPVASKDGYARTTTRYDGAGNVLGKALFDASDKPVIGSDGWASWGASVDAAGHETERRYFDALHAPVETKAGYARHTTRYSDRGGAIEEWWFDAHDRPVAVEGAARVTVRYDEWEHEVQRAWFGADSKPVATVDGIARVEHVYDLQGRLVETAYYGPDGALTKKGEWAKQRLEYDPAGNTQVTSYFGADGKPIRISDGYARVEDDHDGRNKDVEVRYRDEHGELTPNKNGVVIARFDYDAYGNVVKRSFLDKDRKPALSSEGIAGFTSEYDARGNQIKLRTYGIDGAPVAIKEGGWAGFDSRFDDFGHETERQYVGVDGKPALNKKEGYSKKSVTYDPLGREIADWFYDADGKPKTQSNGIAGYKTTYDTGGRETERRYFGADEKPARMDKRYVRYTLAYDPEGRLVKALFFAEDDKPASGCASMTWTYAEWTYAEGGKATRACFDAGGGKTACP